MYQNIQIVGTNKIHLRKEKTKFKKILKENIFNMLATYNKKHTFQEITIYRKPKKISYKIKKEVNQKIIDMTMMPHIHVKKIAVVNIQQMT